MNILLVISPRLAYYCVKRKVTLHKIILSGGHRIDMFECLTKINWKKVGLFASGTLFGTAGIKALASDDAKKLYTNCTAAVLRAKETVMNTVTTVQENAEDIYEGAKQINEERAEAKAAAEFAEEAEAEEETEEETTEEVGAEAVEEAAE